MQFVGHVNRLELWGNIKDGFDCNNVFRSETVRMSDPEALKRYLDTWAKRNVRESLPYKENGKRYHTCGRQCFKCEWTSDTFADIVCGKTGTTIGTIEIHEDRVNEKLA